MANKVKKDEIKQALLDADFGRIAEIGIHSKRVFGTLISLAYDKDSLVTWRAIEAMGLAVGAIAEANPATARDIVHRLLWSVTEESGAIGWSAPEMLAEIVAISPTKFGDLPPIILSLHEEPPFLGGVLWAMGRLAGAGINLPKTAPQIIAENLDSTDPTIRGMALWAASKAGLAGRSQQVSRKIRDMTSDDDFFYLYEDGELDKVKISTLAGMILADLQGD